MNRFSRSHALAANAESELAVEETIWLESHRPKSVALEPIGKVRTPRGDESHTREEFRVLKRHLLARIRKRSGDLDPQVVLVTSARPAEGKTTVTLGLAMSFMLERACRIVLIDADVRTRGLTQRMNLTEGAGLLEYLEDESLHLADVLYRTSVPGIFAIPTGQPRLAAPELLDSPRMGRLLDEIRRSDDQRITIIDTSSLLSCSETVSVARHSGQILFVAAKGQTRRDEVDQAIGILDRGAGHLDETRIALVLNKADKSQSPVRYAKQR